MVLAISEASGCGSRCRGAGPWGELISPRHLTQFVLRYWVHGGCAMCVGLGPLWTTGGFPVPLPPGDPFGFPPPRDMPSFGNASAAEPNRSDATDIAATIASILFISRPLHRDTEKASPAGRDVPLDRERFISKARNPEERDSSGQRERCGRHPHRFCSNAARGQTDRACRGLNIDIPLSATKRG
jgi:hypothetical protein